MKKHCKVLIMLLALLLAAGMLPPLAARAEDFSYTITMSGAASGAPITGGGHHYTVMEGQYITFHVESEDDFDLASGVVGLSGAFTYSQNDISGNVKEVTVRPVNGKNFSGGNTLYLTFFRPGESSSIATENIGIEGKTFETRVTVTPERLTLAKGQTYRFQAAADPAVDNYGRDIEFEWYAYENSDEKRIPLSQDGTVTAAETGRFTIRATSKNTKTYFSIYDCHFEAYITVVDYLPAASVSIALNEGSAGVLSGDTLTIVEGETAQVKAVTDPWNTTDEVTWSGGNGFASVSGSGINATVTASAKGSAVMTATAGDKSCTLTVRVLEHHEAVESTCEANGSIEYWEDADGNKYSDKGGKAAVSDVSAQLADHTLTKIDAAEATCDAPGNTEYWKCSVCGKYFTDAQGENETTEQAVIIKAAHSLKKIGAVSPKCEQDGNIAYWECERCGKLFYDEQGKPEIDDRTKTVLAKLGHDWGDWTVKTPATFEHKGEEERCCRREGCGGTETRDIEKLEESGGYSFRQKSCKWTKRSNKDLTVVVEHKTDNENAYEHFRDDPDRRIVIDGKTVSESNYSFEEGSLKVTFKSSYLETLSKGDHRITVYFIDGTASATLTVKSSGSGDTPGTGDGAGTASIVVAALSFLLAALYVTHSVCGVSLSRAAAESESEPGESERRRGL